MALSYHHGRPRCASVLCQLVAKADNGVGICQRRHNADGAEGVDKSGLKAFDAMGRSEGNERVNRE